MSHQPTTLAELLSYLSRNPWVFAACDDPRVPPLALGLRRFEFRGKHALYFVDAKDGRPRSVPLHWGQFQAGPALTFRPGRFEVVKYGLVVRHHYVSPLLSGGLARCQTTTSSNA